MPDYLNLLNRRIDAGFDEMVTLYIRSVCLIDALKEFKKQNFLDTKDLKSIEIILSVLLMNKCIGEVYW